MKKLSNKRYTQKINIVCLEKSTLASSSISVCQLFYLHNLCQYPTEGGRPLSSNQKNPCKLANQTIELGLSADDRNVLFSKTDLHLKVDTTYLSIGKSSQPHLRFRPVVTPNSAPVFCRYSPSSFLSSLGKAPAPTRVVYAFTTPKTFPILFGGIPSPVHTPPIEQLLDVTQGQVPKSLRNQKLNIETQQLDMI